MTDKQKEILASFPRKDRGLFGEGDDDNEETKADPGEEDLDFLEAAAKKAKLK